MNHALRHAVRSGPAAAAARALLRDLGLKSRHGFHSPGSVFADADAWGFGRDPSLIVAPPAVISVQDRRRLALLDRFSPRVRVFVDDRPGYGEPGTHHVRLELDDGRNPFPKGSRLEVPLAPPAVAGSPG